MGTLTKRGTVDKYTVIDAYRPPALKIPLSRPNELVTLICERPVVGALLISGGLVAVVAAVAVVAIVAIVAVASLGEIIKAAAIVLYLAGGLVLGACLAVALVLVRLARF